MRRLEWTVPALADLRRIEAYLEREATPQVAVRILSAIRFRSTLLHDFPHAGSPIEDRGFRKLSIRETPYLIAYRVRSDRIEILRVHHERENWRMFD